MSSLTPQQFLNKYPAISSNLASVQPVSTNPVQRFFDKYSQTTAGQFLPAFIEESVKTIGGMAQSLAKSPLRIGQTAWDLGQQIAGQEPSQGYNLPILGKVEGYGRQFLNEAGDNAGDWSNLNTIAAGLKAVGEGVIDASFLGGILEKQIAKQALKIPKAVPASEVAQPNTKNIAQTRKSLENIFGGNEPMIGRGETGMTPTSEFITYGKGRLDDVAQKLGQLNPKLEQLYRAQVKPDITSAESVLKSVLEPAKKILDYYERGGLSDNLLTALTKNLPKSAEALKYKSALNTLKSQQGGEVNGLLSNPELGKIDLTWGTTKGEGGGLSKIIADHPDVVENLDDILTRAKVVGGREGRIYLETDDGFRAVVRTDFNEKPKQWLLTAYKKEGQGGGIRTSDKWPQTTRDTASLHPDTTNIPNTKNLSSRGVDNAGMSKIGALLGGSAITGAAMVGAKKLYDFYGLPSSYINNLADEVKNNYSFDLDALKRLEEVNYRKFDFEKEGVKGQYLKRGQDVFNLVKVFGFSDETAQKIADLKISQKVDKPSIRIEKDLQLPLAMVLTHEMLHHISTTKDKETNNKFLEDWWNSWNMMVDKFPEKYPQLVEIDKRIKDSGYSDEPYTIAQERYSFLGQEGVMGGIDYIPEELRDFYIGVIKMPNQNR